LYPTKVESGSTAAINIDGTKTSNTFSRAQGFCDFFSTIAGVLKTKSFPLWGTPLNSRETTSPENFVFNSVSDDKVFRELRNLERNKSTGLDNLFPGMLKDAAAVIKKPLAYIINLSLQSGSVLMEWKSAKVIPLFKSGSLVELDNYRPISILPVLSKILERIDKQLLLHLENNGLLSSFQFGFRSKCSTELSVTYFTDIMRKEVDSGNILGAVFIDLSKAFDTVSHSCLLNKLPSYGINNKELHWFTDYLFSRTQSVQFKGVLSEANPIFSGVPRGSILGLLVFSIHFNDVHTPLQGTSIITYADDTVILMAAKDLASIQKHLSEDCHNLSAWFLDNELVLNLKKGKTECMIFGSAKRPNALNGR